MQTQGFFKSLFRNTPFYLTIQDLYVEGTTTGTEIDKDRKNIHPVQLQQSGSGRLNVDAIDEALHLVRRLEEDRQEALTALASEKVKVKELGVALDAEAERRLDLLGTVVQRGGPSSSDDLNTIS